eukprot:CAMPEP_0117431968 /NCGR_PEP_ID=MMETSP0758-20121206/11512_1 /TAXON_ID=63605 /ORGANISM="Percolomonas cosmopolitus, Strain AE-1 (ATCC 50343)" /LENGTH=55 /DNA_ID=CAMNT_0005221527 /DNA_START=134 /DNA_END=298 /DNA_ORIENTATION=+
MKDLLENQYKDRIQLIEQDEPFEYEMKEETTTIEKGIITYSGGNMIGKEDHLPEK